MFRRSFCSPCQIIGFNLRRIRRSRGWTQEEAARQLEPYLGYKLSRPAFSQAEHCKSGKRRFDADEIVAFARVFEVAIGDFFLPPPPSAGKPLKINGKPGHPRARVTSPPLTGPQLLRLAQGSGGQSIRTRRGRRPWTPPHLAEVEAVAEREGKMEEIARSLKIDPSTLYRTMQNSPPLEQAILMGRQRGLQRRRNDAGGRTRLDTSADKRGASAAELKLRAIPDPEPQPIDGSRQQTDAIPQRVRQPLNVPEVKPITPLGSDAIRTWGLPPHPWICPKCDREVTLSDRPQWNGALLVDHDNCRRRA